LDQYNWNKIAEWTSCFTSLSIVTEFEAPPGFQILTQTSLYESLITIWDIPKLQLS
jgi:hypothetical protein